MTEKRFARPLMLGSMLMAGGLVGQIAHAETYQEVKVIGAALVPEDDIRLTCGDLRGVYLEEPDLRAVEDCLMSTGVFTAVAVQAAGEALVIDVTEVEQKPGRIEGVLSYDTDRSLTATLSYEQYNLWPDTFVAAHVDISRDVESYDASLYRRNAFGEGLHFGLDALVEHSDYHDLDFAMSRRKIEGSLTYAPTAAHSFEAGLGYRSHSLYGLKPGASDLLSRERGQIDAPYLRLRYEYKTTLDQDETGIHLQLEQMLWNLGTSDLVSNTQADVNLRHNLTQDYALLMGLKLGHVSGLKGNNTTALDRFFPGGDSFRGFAPRGVGPVDGQGAHRSHLGGNHYMIASVELQRDLKPLWGHELRGGAFVDVGTAWGLDDDLRGKIDDSKRRRSAVGLSLTFDVAQTPVSLYVAHPLEHQPYDRLQTFGLSVNFSF